MFKAKFAISIFFFVSLLIITSVIKNKTRIIEKKISYYKKNIFFLEKNFNEAQLDFYYLTSPKEIENRLNLIGLNNYQPIKKSKIFLNFSDFTELQNQLSKSNIK